MTLPIIYHQVKTGHHGEYCDIYIDFTQSDFGEIVIHKGRKGRGSYQQREEPVEILRLPLGCARQLGEAILVDTAIAMDKRRG